MTWRQLDLFSDLDLKTDEELQADLDKLNVKHERMRNLVLKGRVPRETLDALTKERDAYKNEVEKRQPANG